MSVITYPAITGESSSGAWVSSASYASLPAGTDAGQRAWCTDGCGFAVRWTGSRWISEDPSVLFSVLSAEATVSGTTSETIIRQVLIPAGYLAAGYVIDMEQTFSKAGAGAGIITGKIRIGTTGTVSDAVISSGQLAASGSVSSRWNPKIRIYDATTAVAPPMQLWVAGGGNTNAIATVTIPNVSNALYVSATVTLASGDSATIKSSELYIGRTA